MDTSSISSSSLSSTTSTLEELHSKASDSCRENPLSTLVTLASATFAIIYLSLGMPIIAGGLTAGLVAFWATKGILKCCPHSDCLSRIEESASRAMFPYHWEGREETKPSELTPTGLQLPADIV